MHRLTALAAALALTACTQTPPATPQVASVTMPGGETFAVHAGPRGWVVHVDGARVHCPKPDERSCYWATRAHLNAVATVHDLPG